MDLPEDTIREICSRMNVDALYNFIQTSEHNYKLCTRIYDLKYYEEVEYPELMFFYNAKQYILKQLRLMEKKDLRNPTQTHTIVVRSQKKDDAKGYGFVPIIGYFNQIRYQNRGWVNIPEYPKLFIDVSHNGDESYVYPNMYEVIQYIMNVEDPNIKLEELRRLV